MFQKTLLAVLLLLTSLANSQPGDTDVPEYSITCTDGSTPLWLDADVDFEPFTGVPTDEWWVNCGDSGLSALDIACCAATASWTGYEWFGGQNGPYTGNGFAFFQQPNGNCACPIPCSILTAITNNANIIPYVGPTISCVNDGTNCCCNAAGDPDCWEVCFADAANECTCN